MSLNPREIEILRQVSCQGIESGYYDLILNAIVEKDQSIKIPTLREDS